VARPPLAPRSTCPASKKSCWSVTALASRRSRPPQRPPLNITWASEHVPAILEAWYPGTQAAPLSQPLFGDAIPVAAPLSWPRNVGQIPINYAHNLTRTPASRQTLLERAQYAALPFGYGLSYSTFAFSDLKVAQAENKIGQPIHVSVEVENTGSVPPMRSRRSTSTSSTATPPAQSASSRASTASPSLRTPKPPSTSPHRRRPELLELRQPCLDRRRHHLRPLGRQQLRRHPPHPFTRSR